MTAQEHPFVRVYYGIIDDPKFASVYADDRRLATWLRLLIAADAMYPSPAPIPRSCHSASLAHLVAVHLIELLGADHFRIVGLEKERNGRYAGGKGRSKFPSDNHSDSESEPESGAIPNRSNLTRPDQPIQSGPDLTDHDALDTYHELTGYRPWGEFSGDGLKGAIGDYGNERTDAALRAEYAVDGDRKTILKRALARLARDADHAKEATRRKPRAPSTDTADVKRELMALYAKEPD